MFINCNEFYEEGNNSWGKGVNWVTGIRKLLKKICRNLLGKNLGLGWGMYVWQRKRTIDAITWGGKGLVTLKKVKNTGWL